MKSFTIIEVVVVIVIIGIVSAVAANSLNDLRHIRTTQAAYRLKTDIRFAQSYAIATGNRTRLSFNFSSESYSVYYEDSGGNWVLLRHPYTRSDFTVDFSQGEYAGTDIVSSDLVASNYDLVFDKKGNPYGYSAGSLATALASEGNISLNNAYVKIEPNTGRVWIEQ